MDRRGLRSDDKRRAAVTGRCKLWADAPRTVLDEVMVDNGGRLYVNGQK